MRNRHLKSIIAVLIMAAVLFAAAGCGNEDPNAETAKINDTVITKTQFDNFCTLWLYTQGYDPSEDLTSEQKSMVLGDMIDAEALRQYYEENDPSVFSDSYQSGLDTFLNQTKQNDAEFITNNNISDDDITFYYMSQYLTQLCFDEIKSEQTSEELYSKASAYYDKHKEDFGDETLDEALEEIYYLLYSEMYNEKLSQIKDDMTIEQ